jgi:predicted aspartyl protease
MSFSCSPLYSWRQSSKTSVRYLCAPRIFTGAWTLAINEAVREKLGLEITKTEPGTLADGTQSLYNMAGLLEIRWKKRRAVCEALVLPDAGDVLLGGIPLTAMDLTVSQEKQEVVGIHGDEVLMAI